MNCKEGDTAIVVREDDLGNRGALVDVTDGCCKAQCWRVTLLSRYRQRLPFFEGIVQVYQPGTRVCIPDAHLKPLRDGYGSDETLQWAGLPNKIPEVQS